MCVLSTLIRRMICGLAFSSRIVNFVIIAVSVLWTIK